MKKTILLAIVILAIIGAVVYLERLKPVPLKKGEEINIETRESSKDRASVLKQKEKQYPRVKEIVGATGFINTENPEGISMSDLAGKKVILIDFWTYSCINCQRTTPYLNSWYEKYHDSGLEIVGFHTPEFDFEKKYDNVKKAVEKFGIRYPVVLDNEYANWRTYKNRYWPRKYLVDIDGFIVYDHIGEGAYEETEQKIQDLLKERNTVLGESREVATDMVAPVDVPQVDYQKKNSPEVYFGYERNTFLGNGKMVNPGIQNFTLPTQMETNRLYLDGSWNITPEYAENTSSNAKIIFRYVAKDVYMVANAENDTALEITLDGKPVGDMAGEDIDPATGRGTVNEDRLYKLVQAADYGEHTLEILIQNPGLRAFTLTFG